MSIFSICGKNTPRLHIQLRKGKLFEILLARIWAYLFKVLQMFEIFHFGGN